jgi:hypothetical protein
MRDRAGFGGPAGALVLAGGLLGALLLLVAEFTTLFEVHTASSPGPIRSIGTGSHHSYAMALIAVVVGAFAIGAWRTGSRPALLAVGVLGIVSLLIALLGDLPDAHAQNLLVGSPTTHLQLANATPSAGLYMETAGAAVLIITCVCAFILLGPPQPVSGLTTAARER